LTRENIENVFPHDTFIIAYRCAKVKLRDWTNQEKEDIIKRFE